MTDKLILIPVPTRSKSWARELLATSARGGGKGATFAKAWIDEWLDPPPQHWLRVQPDSPPLTYSPDVWHFPPRRPIASAEEFRREYECYWPPETYSSVQDAITALSVRETFKTWGPADRIPLREAMTAVKRAIEAAGYE